MACHKTYRIQGIIYLYKQAGLGGSVGCTSDWSPGGRQHSFVEIDHELFSTVILSLPLIQEGQLSVSAKECAQYWLTT